MNDLPQTQLETNLFDSERANKKSCENEHQYIYWEAWRML